MKIVRIFMHPDGDTVLDIGVPDDFNMPIWWNQIKTDGAVTAEGAIIPTSVIHHATMLQAAPAAQTFTLVPGGKPN